MSLNTVNSVHKMGATIDSSRENFGDYANLSKERRHIPHENIALNIGSDHKENVHSNMNRTRNNPSMKSLTIKSSVNSNSNIKMIKSSTLTKLRPSSSTEFSSHNIPNSGKYPQTRMSLGGEKYGYNEEIRTSGMATQVPQSYIQLSKNMETLNSS